MNDGLGMSFDGCSMRRGAGKMRNLRKTTVIVLVCWAMLNGAGSGNVARGGDSTSLPQLPADLKLPFVSVSLPETPIYVGDVAGPGSKQVGAQFMARVVANCAYHVQASFQGLQHEGGGIAIAPENLSVWINGKAVAVGTGRVAIAQASRPTSASGVDVPVNLRMAVSGLESYPPGQYCGAFVITVMATP